MSGKLLDSSTAAALYTLHALAVDRTLNLSVDFCPLRAADRAWIVQLWSPDERELTTARAPTLALAVSAALDQVRAQQLA